MRPLFCLGTETYSQGPVLGRRQDQLGHGNGSTKQPLRVRAGREVLVVENGEGRGRQVEDADVQVKLVGQGAQDGWLGRAVTEQHGFDKDRVTVRGIVEMQCLLLRETRMEIRRKRSTSAYNGALPPSQTGYIHIVHD